MLANAQQPLYFEGFRIWILDLETFTIVSEPWGLFECAQMSVQIAIVHENAEYKEI